MVIRFSVARWKRICDLSSELLDSATEAWDSILDRECSSDEELRAEVLAVCRNYSETDDLFGVPVLSPLGLEDSLIGQRIGPWEILRLLGEGGMGRVYLVERRDGVFTQYAALKLNRERADPDSVTRFQAERQILAMLEHPSIARAIDGGATPAGAPYLVMEYVEGGVPIDVFRPGGPVRDQIRLFLQVVAAVEAAHRQQVAHRDLKPSNILVTADGRVKVLDFGIAKLFQGDGMAVDHTHTAEAALTPTYASPEQLLREPTSLASDIYSLGAVLYKILTGRPPHDLAELNLLEAVRIVTETDAAAPSSLARGLDGDVDAMVLKALERDRARRYSSTTEFADDLRRYLDGFPVQARKGAIWYGARRFVRRHRGWTAAAAMFFLVLAGAAGVAVRDWRLETQRVERVRRTAGPVIADYQSQLSKLTGSTMLQAQIAAAEKKYLDGLYPDASQDVGLRRQLAAAYGSVASHEAEKAAARDSLQKSFRLWQELLRGPVNHGDRLRAAVAARRLGWIQISLGQLTDAGASLAEGMRLLDSLPESGRDEAVRVERVTLYFEMSRLGAWEGDGEKAISFARKAVAEHETLPPKPLDHHSIAFTRMQLADTTDTYGSGDPKLLKEALRQTRLAVRLVRDAAACEETSCREVKASILTRAPIVFMHQGLLQEALALRDGVDIAEELLAEDPGNRNAISSLHFGLYNLGWLLNETGKLEESLRVRRRLLELSVVLRKNPGSAEDRLNEAIACREVGLVLMQLERLQEAQGYFLRSAEILAHPPTENVYWFMRQADIHRDLGQLYEKLGRAGEARSEFGKESAAASLFLAKTGSTLAKELEAGAHYREGKALLAVDRVAGCGLLQKSLERFREMKSAGRENPDWEATSQKVVEAIQGCGVVVSSGPGPMNGVAADAYLRD